MYAEYPKKPDDREKELDAPTVRQKKFMAAEFAAEKRYEVFLGDRSD